jgi:hypothetical protein
LSLFFITVPLEISTFNPNFSEDGEYILADGAIFKFTLLGIKLNKMECNLFCIFLRYDMKELYHSFIS